MNNNSKHFKLFSDCIPVRGKKRSIIYDLTRSNYQFIPNDLYFMLQEHEGKSIQQIKKIFGKYNDTIIDEYFEFLKKNEFIFFCDKDELKLFEKLSHIWDYPGIITNAIIELPLDDQLLSILISSLENFGCRSIQFRSLASIETAVIDALLKKMIFSEIEHIEFVYKYKIDDIDKLIDLLQTNQRVRYIYLYNSSQNSVRSNPLNERQKIIESSTNIANHKDFQKNSIYYFNVDISLFFESQQYNNYYNRKLAISSEGEIKNCLSLEKSFGKIIHFQNLKNIVMSQEFQELWNVTKDDIYECKECEFRYMCVDNTPLIKSNEIWRLSSQCLVNNSNDL